MSKNILQMTTETLDHETGEVKEHTTTKVYSLPKEPPFIKVYLEDISKIYELPNNSSGVFYELLRRLDYEGYITLNSTIKTIICDRTGYKPQSLNNYLSSLVKKGLLKKVGRGVFSPDPHLFGRGDWKSISKMRENWLKISYDKDGNRVFESAMSEKNS